MRLHIRQLLSCLLRDQGLHLPGGMPTWVREGEPGRHSWTLGPFSCPRQCPHTETRHSTGQSIALILPLWCSLGFEKVNPPNKQQRTQHPATESAVDQQGPGQSVGPLPGRDTNSSTGAGLPLLQPKSVPHKTCNTCSKLCCADRWGPTTAFAPESTFSTQGPDLTRQGSWPQWHLLASLQRGNGITTW